MTLAMHSSRSSSRRFRTFFLHVFAKLVPTGRHSPTDPTRNRHFCVRVTGCDNFRLEVTGSFFCFFSGISFVFPVSNFGQAREKPGDNSKPATQGPTSGLIQARPNELHPLPLAVHKTCGIAWSRESTVLPPPRHYN